MSKSLKPCLHCEKGSGQITVLNGFIVAQCDNCGVIIIGADLTEDGAIDAWNRRPEGKECQESVWLVELPCKVGDMVYEPRLDRGFISSYEIKEIGIGKSGVEFLYWTLIDGIYSNVNGVEACNIGKTVFLTCDKAEAALKEADNG